MASLQLSGRDVQILLCELAAGAERYRAQDDSLSPAIAEQRDDLRGRLLAAIAGDPAPEMVLPDTAACKADADTIRSLEAAREKLRDRAARQDRQIGHLMVDRDRQVERARQEAHDCAEHGREIQELRHMASWQWDHAQEQSAARGGFVTALINVKMGLTGEPVPADVLAAWLDKAIDAGNKAIGRKNGYPNFADCQRAGGCDHDGLCDGLKAEIAEALGIVPPAAPGAPAGKQRAPRSRPARPALSEQAPLDLCVPGVIP